MRGKKLFGDGFFSLVSILNIFFGIKQIISAWKSPFVDMRLRKKELTLRVEDFQNDPDGYTRKSALLPEKEEDKQEIGMEENRIDDITCTRKNKSNTRDEKLRDTKFNAVYLRAEEGGFEVLEKATKKFWRKGKIMTMFTRKKKTDILASVPEENSWFVSTDPPFSPEQDEDERYGYSSKLTKAKIMHREFRAQNTHTKIEDAEFNEIINATQTLVNDVTERQKVAYQAEADDVKDAISKFRQYAKKLGLEERELMQVVQSDQRSIQSGLIMDDGTIVSTVGGTRTATTLDHGTSTLLGDGTNTYMGTLDITSEFTTDSEYREKYPVFMRLLDIFDYYFVAD
jgi:hypothetical protein